MDNVSWLPQVSSQKDADPHAVEDYMDAFEEFSKNLLQRVVNLADVNVGDDSGSRRKGGGESSSDGIYSHSGWVLGVYYSALATWCWSVFDFMDYIQ